MDNLKIQLNDERADLLLDCIENIKAYKDYKNLLLDHLMDVFGESASFRKDDAEYEFHMLVYFLVRELVRNLDI